jgi:hypothetical protein
MHVTGEAIEFCNDDGAAVGCAMRGASSASGSTTASLNALERPLISPLGG